MYTNKQKTHFPWTSCFGILYDFLPLRSNTLATLLGLLFWPLVCFLLFPVADTHPNRTPLWSLLRFSIHSFYLLVSFPVQDYGVVTHFIYCFQPLSIFPCLIKTLSRFEKRFTQVIAHTLNSWPENQGILPSQKPIPLGRTAPSSLAPGAGVMSKSIAVTSSWLTQGSCYSTSAALCQGTSVQLTSQRKLKRCPKVKQILSKHALIQPPTLDFPLSP